MSGAQIDSRRAACLCDVGAPNYVAAVCITDDGDEALWLVHKDELDSDNPAHGHADQPHERLGRLPLRWRERVWGDDLRCGRPRANGQPCRHRVKERGQSCAAHCDGQSCGKCRSCYLAAEASR
ncbi:hypothetical protein [Mycolicibacterium austroafricanum]|uniref:hypothetical protein n=1 Tax=Mycolicibacterium austroafricanum TaxID=39687 RepID=UPI001CA33C74|nr:hypothetical protein [Mycolicibacterium austroafricanum]QZT60935.1 hypothetical protein JN085_18195 [Mycolicibacterium austroafricanum]